MTSRQRRFGLDERRHAARETGRDAHFTGTNDNVSLIRDMTLEQRRVPFDNIHAPGRRLITFEGGDQMVFSGNSLPNTDTSKYALSRPDLPVDDDVLGCRVARRREGEGVAEGRDER